jgi:hypothetical protein
MAWDLPYEATLPPPGPCIGCAPHHPLGPCIGHTPHPTVIGETNTRHEEVPMFTHSIRTRVNAVKFTHQSLCNLKILTFLKAVRRGFLKRCPNIIKKLILKYLNPSPATAKGHMKQPRHGICSTTPKATARQSSIHVPAITVPLQPTASIRDGLEQVSGQVSEQVSEYKSQRPNLKRDDGDESIAHVFVFRAFADKNSRIIYHDLTGPFPFMSLDGSACFFVMYHYKLNCILASPIVGLGAKSIFAVYEKRFKELELKGFKPKLIVMDNQATKHIKQFLTENECRL